MSPRIVLFDLHHGGHHPQYLEVLVRKWERLRVEGDLHLVISDVAADRAPDLCELVAGTPRAELHVAAVPAAFAGAGIVTRERVNRRFATLYAERLRPDHLLFMFLDTAQLALAADLRFAWPLALSGIYFRPTFHYEELGVRATARERLITLGKAVAIRGALRNPHLKTLFMLDPHAVRVLERWARHTDCVFLPEPLRLADAGASPPGVVSEVEPGRRRIVLFGVLDMTKKGISQVLDALEALPESAQRAIALILAGPIADTEREPLLARLARFEERATAVQLVLTAGPIPEDEIQPLIASSDLALAPYLRHVGSSGVLVRAAAAGIPVLASDYGLVGMTVRDHGLGAAVDTRCPDAIRDAIAAWLADPEAIAFDSKRAARFARSNTDDSFARTIFGGLLGGDAAAQ